MEEEKFPAERFIAHAGGAILGAKYTNSLEAFDEASGSVALIELDFCNALDGLIVAHDGLEKSYGLSLPFSAVSVGDFLKSKFMKKLTPMSLDYIFARLGSLDCRIIMDMKSESPGQYRNAMWEVARIASAHGVMAKVVPQVYSVEDRDAVNDLGFESFILALWKNFGDIRSPACQECIEYCFSKKVDGLSALSVAARHFWRDGQLVALKLANRLFEECGSIFVHGHPSEAEPELLRAGFGIFSHNAVSWVKD